MRTTYWRSPPEAIKEVPPTEAEKGRGEGVIGREATFTVDQVLWSTGSPKKEAPKTFRMQFMGWEFKDGDTSRRTKMAVEDQPRIEAGHSYLIAVSWMEQYCELGDSDYYCFVTEHFEVLSGGVGKPV